MVKYYAAKLFLPLSPPPPHTHLFIRVKFTTPGNNPLIAAACIDLKIVGLHRATGNHVVMAAVELLHQLAGEQLKDDHIELAGYQEEGGEGERGRSEGKRMGLEFEIMANAAIVDLQREEVHEMLNRRERKLSTWLLGNRYLTRKLQIKKCQIKKCLMIRKHVC